MTTLGRGRSPDAEPSLLLSGAIRQWSTIDGWTWVVDPIGSNTSGGDRWVCIRDHLDWL